MLPARRCASKLNIGGLLFFAYFTDGPLIVLDDATRAMLCDQSYTVLSAVGSHRASRRQLRAIRRLLLYSLPRQAVYGYGQNRHLGSRRGFRASSMRRCTTTPRPDANGAALCGHTTAAAMPAAPSHRFGTHSLSALPSDASQRRMLALRCCWRRRSPDMSPYQRGTTRQKNALPPAMRGAAAAPKGSLRRALMRARA